MLQPRHATRTKFSHRPPRGAILPLALVLLLLSAAVLAHVCRRDMANTLEADRQAEELQRQWGMHGIELTLLPRAGAILAQPERASGRPMPAVAADVQLGKQSFHLRFADEQAKTNLNAAYNRQGRGEVDKLARTAARASHTALRVNVRPFGRGARARTQTDGPPVFGALGQVFDEASATPAMLSAATTDLTCWGSGKLNWRRASQESLESIFPDDQSAVRQIIALRQAGPEASITQALNQMNLTPDKRGEIENRFTDSSACQSLWVFASEGLGAEARLCVSEQRDDGRTRVYTFGW